MGVRINPHLDILIKHIVPKRLSIFSLTTKLACSLLALLAVCQDLCGYWHHRGLLLQYLRDSAVIIIITSNFDDSADAKPSHWLHWIQNMYGIVHIVFYSILS